MSFCFCNYAIIRFHPSTGNGEFVNVGVVAACPQTGELDYELEKTNNARVRRCFPELDHEVYGCGLEALVTELERLKQFWAMNASLHRPTSSEDIKQEIARFRELVRPRESLFRFSDIGTLMGSGLQDAVRDLFGRYVNRLFAQAPEYQEKVMQKRLSHWLREWDVSRLYRATAVGTEAFHVAFPFVRKTDDEALTAIKPLDLDKKDPNEIYERGGTWVTRVARLRKYELLPQRTVFPVTLPADGIQRVAAEEIIRELTESSGIVVPFENRERIRELVTTDLVR